MKKDLVDLNVEHYDRYKIMSLVVEEEQREINCHLLHKYDNTLILNSSIGL